MGKVVTVFNQKGGVGKTTTNINLSVAIANLGKKVLIIDNDPQGNSTSGIGIDKSELSSSLYEALIGIDSINNCIIHTDNKNVDILPSNLSLAGAEIEMTNIDQREYLLKNIIGEIKDLYDYIFIDCPPSLGLLTLNSLIAADSVIIPIQCEYYALEGVSQLMNTYRLVKKGLNSKLEIQGVVLNMYDGRNNLSVQVADEVKNFFKGKVYSTIIPRNIRLAEAPSFGLSIFEYDGKSKGAIAYKELAEEFIWLEGEQF
ncbi:MAG: AAA family ATPase [Bacillota bacterium]|nr:AAA family ATPase [Bacillota bacterium]